MVIESRGEFMVVPLDAAASGQPLRAVQLPGTAGTRERGAVWVEDGLACVSDGDDGSRLVVLDPEDATASPRELLRSPVWLGEPVASPDGTWVAVGDKTGLLRAVHAKDGKVVEVARSADGVISDFRFSPAGQWIAWTHPLPNGLGQVRLRNLETGAMATWRTA